MRDLRSGQVVRVGIVGFDGVPAIDGRLRRGDGDVWQVDVAGGVAAAFGDGLERMALAGATTWARVSVDVPDRRFGRAAWAVLSGAVVGPSGGVGAPI
ncbi:MAG: hypothetical protein ACU0CO_07770 [Shimia sp.]